MVSYIWDTLCTRTHRARAVPVLRSYTINTCWFSSKAQTLVNTFKGVYFQNPRDKMSTKLVLPISNRESSLFRILRPAMYPVGTSRERKKKHALLHVALCCPNNDSNFLFKYRNYFTLARENGKIEGPDCKQSLPRIIQTILRI